MVMKLLILGQATDAPPPHQQGFRAGITDVVVQAFKSLARLA